MPSQNTSPSQAPIAPDSEHPNCFRNVREYQWTDAFYNKDLVKFRENFTKDVTQSASTAPYVNYGIDEVSETFNWASKFYKQCNFTYQANTGDITFLEFDLKTLNNMSVTGMTVLTKDSSGKVVNIFNGHRNLTEAVLFSEHFVQGPKDKGIVSLFHKRAFKEFGIENKFPRNPTGFLKANEVLETEFVEAMRIGVKEYFQDICDVAVSLSGSYVANTVCGVEDVSEVLVNVADFYEHCIFTHQATYENRTYLLYKGRLRNGLVVSDGFMILVRNDEGKITEVMDNPIPLHAGTLISSYVASKINDPVFVRDYLYTEHLFSDAVHKYSLDGVIGKETKDLTSFKGFIAQFFLKV